MLLLFLFTRKETRAREASPHGACRYYLYKRSDGRVHVSKLRRAYPLTTGNYTSVKLGKDPPSYWPMPPFPSRAGSSPRAPHPDSFAVFGDVGPSHIVLSHLPTFHACTSFISKLSVCQTGFVLFGFIF